MSAELTSAKPDERLATAMKAFTERLEQRVRVEVAETIPNDVIDGMVETTTRRLFFEHPKVRNPKWRPYDNWNQEKEFVDGPCLFETMVVEAMTPILAKRVETLIQDSPQKIAEVIENVIKGGILRLLFATIEHAITNSVLVQQGVAVEGVLSRLREKGLAV